MESRKELDWIMGKCMRRGDKSPWAKTTSPERSTIYKRRPVDMWTNRKSLPQIKDESRTTKRRNK